MGKIAFGSQAGVRALETSYRAAADTYARSQKKWSKAAKAEFVQRMETVSNVNTRNSISSVFSHLRIFNIIEQVAKDMFGAAHNNMTIHGQDWTELTDLGKSFV